MGKGGARAPRRSTVSRRVPLASPRVLRKNKAVEKGKPLATVVLGQAQCFFATYGQQPGFGTQLHQTIFKLAPEDREQVLAVFAGVDANIREAMRKKAYKYIVAVRRGSVSNLWKKWAAGMRWRGQVVESCLSRALAAHAHVGRPRQVSVAETSKVDTTLDQTVNLDGTVACVPWTSAFGETMRLTPPNVGNWLYQALVDVHTALQHSMRICTFDSAGRPSDPGPCGEVLLWWGTHLGSVREQALIAWDYDADLAIMTTPDLDFDAVWAVAQGVLTPHGYRCTQHGVKFRIAPPKALVWAPFKELYQETREANPRDSRATLVQKTSRAWNAGKTARRPHGCNCIDMEVYKVMPGKPLHVLGNNVSSIALPKLFPTAFGVFGPLRFRIPRTPSILQSEYGQDCLKTRRYKAFTAAGHVRRDMDLVPHDCRRALWPCVPIERCKNFLS